MVDLRWLRWIGPGIVALGAVGFIAATTLGASAPPLTLRACAGPPADRVAAARDAAPPSPADLRRMPWFRLDPLLDGDGALRAERLAVGLNGETTARSLELTAESFAAGPFGRVVLAGSDDGVTSRLRAIDVASGCAWVVGEERSIIRRATIDPAGAFIYEMRVERTSRADLGIWRRPLDGLAPARRVLAPLAADGRFGRTFSTEFTWDVGGDRLAVQSCGEVICRTRVVALNGGPPMSLEAPDVGQLIGLDGDRVVTYAACRGLPCPIVSTNVRTGQRTVLAPAAGLAIVVPTADGSRLIHEVDAAEGLRLRAIALDGRATVDLGPLPDGLRLHPSGVRADAATRLPAGWILLAPEGRIPADPTSDHPQLRHVTDGATVPLHEDLR